MKKILFLSLVILVFVGCGKNERSAAENRKQEKNDTFIDTIPEIKPTVNVYIENSGSMGGYVKGFSDFKDAIANYLTDIKISGLSDSLNLFFVNKKIDKIGSDVNAYLGRLTTSCNAATTDIAQIFQLVLSQTNNEEISIFVTDGIFSPEKGKEPTQYLKQQQINIKKSVANHLLENPNTSITIYKLLSNFDGIYYNLYDAKSIINELRPYYIFVIGDINSVYQLKDKISESNFKGGGIKNSYTLLPAIETKIDYAILNSPKYGDFQRDKKSPKTSIYKIKKSNKGNHKGQFMFTIGMDLERFRVLLGDEYLMDSNSYVQLIDKQVNSDYLIEMKYNSVLSTNHTHNMQLTTDKIVTGGLEINLRNNFPQWIEDTNDDDGLIAVEDKTFGIKYLIEGIYEAYINTENTTYSTMKFNLKK